MSVKLGQVDNEMIADLLDQLPQAQVLFARALRKASQQGRTFKPVVKVSLVELEALKAKPEAEKGA